MKTIGRQLIGHLKSIWVTLRPYAQCVPAQVRWGPRRSWLQPTACLQPTAPSVWPWRNWPLGLGTGESVCRGKHTQINELVGACAWVCVCLFSFHFCSIANLSSCHSSNLVSGSSSLQEYPTFTAVSASMKRSQKPHSETCSCSTAVTAAPLPSPASVCRNTFFVPSQYPYFEASLLKQSDRLGNALLKPILDRRHPYELRSKGKLKWERHLGTDRKHEAWF